MRYLAQQNIKDVFGTINPPSQLGGLKGAEGINTVLTNAITLIFTVGAVVFVFMFLISGVQMIMSGGDKETLARARGRLTWAIIGIVLLSLAFVIFRILEQVTGFKFIIPTGQLPPNETT